MARRNNHFKITVTKTEVFRVYCDNPSDALKKMKQADDPNIRQKGWKFVRAEVETKVEQSVYLGLTGKDIWTDVTDEVIAHVRSKGGAA